MKLRSTDQMNRIVYPSRIISKNDAMAPRMKRKRSGPLRPISQNSRLSPPAKQKRPAVQHPLNNAEKESKRFLISSAADNITIQKASWGMYHTKLTQE